MRSIALLLALVLVIGCASDRKKASLMSTAELKLRFFGVVEYDAARHKNAYGLPEENRVAYIHPFKSLGYMVCNSSASAA
jgi:hypothetical protein